MILTIAMFCRDIYIGDAIVRVNDEMVSDASHEEALDMLQVQTS